MELLYNRENNREKGKAKEIKMKKHILVVDDQPGIRFLLEEVFTNEGYQVTTANTGKEALNQVHASTFDLIMMDYKLPIMDGVHVLRQLEENEIIIPVILMSGLPDEIKEDGRSSLLLKHILPKPFNIVEVCNIVKDIIE